MNLAPLIQAAAARVPVACEHCDADYRVNRDPEHDSITMLTIVHDDECPFYRQRQNRAARRATRK